MKQEAQTHSLRMTFKTEPVRPPQVTEPDVCPGFQFLRALGNKTRGSSPITAEMADPTLGRLEIINCHTSCPTLIPSRKQHLFYISKEGMKDEGLNRGKKGLSPCVVQVLSYLKLFKLQQGKKSSSSPPPPLPTQAVKVSRVTIKGKRAYSGYDKTDQKE